MKPRSLLMSLILVLMLAGTSFADVEAYIGDLNLYAGKQFGNFRAEVMARFNISESRFDMMLKQVDSPGDLAVALWIGKQTVRSPDDVIRQYRIHRGKGWGVVARELGVKPGSPEFKALKSGRIGWYPNDFDAVVTGGGTDSHQKKKEKKRKDRDK